MDKNSKIILSGIFRSKEGLSEMLNYLEKIGVSGNDVSLLMSEDTKNSEFSINTKNKAPEDAIKGFATGSVVGAMLGGLTMAGAVVIPPLGLVVAGPIIGMVTGIATGGVIGSLIGALKGIGVPAYEAKFYDKAIKEKGNILLVVHIDKTLKSDIESHFDKCGAISISKQ